MNVTKIVSLFLLALIAAVGICIAMFVRQETKIDSLLKAENFLEAAVCVQTAALPVVLGPHRDGGAADLYLLAYLSERAGDKKLSAESLSRADAELPVSALVKATENLESAASMLQYRLHLGCLSEACLRADVQLARRRHEASPLGDKILAKSLLSLGRDYRLNGKFNLAARAQAEAISVCDKALSDITQSGVVDSDMEVLMKDCLKAQLELFRRLGQFDECKPLLQRLERLESGK